MKNIITLSLLSIVLFISCSEEYKQEIKVNSTGKAGEVLIVIDNYRWESQIGDTLFESFSAPFEVLPQEEASYRVSHTSLQNFNNILTKHRNILIIKIDKNLKNEILEYYDKWAINQLVIQINSSNDSSFLIYWSENKKNIIRTFFNEDIKRLQISYSKYLNTKAIEKVKDKFDIDIQIPTDYNIDVIKDDFCWISKETPKSSQSILIYSYPFTDSLQLIPENIIKKKRLNMQNECSWTTKRNIHANRKKNRFFIRKNYT